MKRFIFIAGLLILGANPGFAQSGADIASKYGKPLDVYSAGEHVWMAPEFASNGQICRMSLFPRRISPGNNYLYQNLPFEEFQAVVDQLVPLSSRGAKSDPFYGGTWATGGGAAWAIFTYQNVSIMYSVGFRIDPESWDKRRPFSFAEEYLKLPDSDRKAVAATPADDFASYRGSKVEIVTIDWSDRKCVSK